MRSMQIVYTWYIYTTAYFTSYLTAFVHKKKKKKSARSAAEYVSYSVSLNLFTAAVYALHI